MTSGNNKDISLNAKLLDDKVLTAHNYTRSNYITKFLFSNLNKYDTTTISFTLAFETAASPGNVVRI